ncbi:DUF4241 domain-containing protein [Streptomyces sp. HC307]|uniref:DUF4241 domain-containing protein n=1 Tax=Streptomyces flavusporus TaxID=3385496 RepID=UPI0039173BEC
MGGDGRTVVVSYATGWDLSSGTALGPLSGSEAEARDRAGEPYVMVHRVEGRSAPVEVHLVAWGDHYVGAWAYDDQTRRTREMDWRLIEPGRLFLRHFEEWRYGSPTQAEFAEDAWRTSTDLFPDGKGRKVSEPKGRRGSSLHTLADIPETDRWRDRSTLGVRGVRNLLFPHEALVGRHVTYRDSSGAVGDGAPAAQTPWLPPRPAEPEHLRELFEPGTRMATRFEPEMTVDGVRDIAVLRVPSGRLTVADPLMTGNTAGRELTERIPPGAYPVQAAVVAYEGRYEDERFPVEEDVAIRLLVDAEPPVSWELALAEGDDARLLRDREIFGFDTDSAAGCFADSSGWEVLAHKYRSYVVDRQRDAGENVGEGFIRTSDDMTGSDLVSFYTGGDGTYPVWLGRSESGKLVSVVVECGYLPDLRVL